MIGYGNLLREDDAFGPAVIERLHRRKLPGGCGLFSCHQLTPELAEKLVGFERVIFVDAALGETVGVLAVPLQARVLLSGLSHHTGPAVVIKALETLYAQRCEYLVFSYMTDCFGYGEGLSREAALQAERLSRYLGALCERALLPGGR